MSQTRRRLASLAVDGSAGKEIDVAVPGLRIDPARPTAYRAPTMTTMRIRSFTAFYWYRFPPAA
jgi:hypothetical protein